MVIPEPENVNVEIDECSQSKLEFTSEIPNDGKDYVMLENGSNPTFLLNFDKNNQTKFF